MSISLNFRLMFRVTVGGQGWQYVTETATTFLLHTF